MSHATPMPRPPGPPPAAGPVAAYLSQPQPGLSVDGRYLVLPQAVLEGAPLEVQRQFVRALILIHDTSRQAPWPQGYRVTALSWRPIVELDETELAEAGLFVELDVSGNLVHRVAATSQPIDEQDLGQKVPVSALDPLYRTPSAAPPG